MKRPIHAAIAAIALALPAPVLAEAVSIGGGPITSGRPAQAPRGFYVVEIPTTGTARILEIVEDPRDATQVVRPGACGGFVPLTASGGSRCITSTVTVGPAPEPAQ